MSGPFLILILLMAIVLLVKYPSHARKVSASIGQVMGGVRGIVSAKNAPSILLIFLALAILFWGFNTPIQLADVENLVFSHWAMILFVCAVISILIVINTSGKMMKTLLQSVVIAMFVLFIGLPVGTWVANIGSQDHPPEKAMLSMPANGNSSRISAPAGYAVAFTGNGFTTHCVYTDGSEGIVGDRMHPCKDGPMIYQYVHDTTGRANSVTYTFTRPVK